MFPVGSHVYLSQMKDQSSSAWLQLICEQLALLQEKKEVPLLRVVVWGLCYQLSSKGAFLGDGDFHPSKRRGAQAFLDAHVKSFVLSCWRAVPPVSGNTQGWQAGYLEIGERNLCSLLTLEWKVHSIRFLPRELLQSPGAAASRTSGPSHQCWSLENETAQWNWRQFP